MSFGQDDSGNKGFLASAAIARYLRVKLTAGLLAVAGIGDRGLGILRDAAFAANDPRTIYLYTKPGTLPMVASGAITLGAKVYPDAGGKVTATANGPSIGIALNATSADGDYVEVVPGIGSSGVVYESVAASTAVANTTVETLFDTNFTLPANLLQVGDTIDIEGQVIATNTHSTDTLTLNLRIGGVAGTSIVATAAVDVATNDEGYFKASLTIRTIGAIGTFVATGVQGLGTPGTVTAKPFFKASTAIDTTAVQQIGITATWSVADATNSCRLDNLIIRRSVAA